MSALPANISVSSARLPQTYEAAKTALAECSAVDECKDWADKAAALASYAKQSNDDTLEKLAMRIRARAIRRAGELLKQIEPSKGGRPAEQTRAGDDLSYSRKQAALEAGMSERQQKTALRVATIPEPDFQKQVDGDFPDLTQEQQAEIDATLEDLKFGAISREEANERIESIDPDWRQRSAHRPPTITDLAKQGIQHREPPPDPQQWLKGRDPKAFNRALHFTADITNYADDLAKWDLSVLEYLDEGQREEIRTALQKIDAIHDQVATRI